MATKWKDDLCPKCKVYICYTNGYAVCKICKLSIDNTDLEEEQLELPLDFEEDKNDR